MVGRSKSLSLISESAILKSYKIAKFLTPASRFARRRGQSDGVPAERGVGFAGPTTGDCIIFARDAQSEGSVQHTTHQI